MNDNLYQEQIRRPKTIDVLQTNDCLEIILRDLSRYGVPETVIGNLITNYYAPLRDEIYRLKKEYGNKCFSNSPDYIFFD